MSDLKNKVKSLTKENTDSALKLYASLKKEWIDSFAPERMSLHDKALLTGQTVYDVLRNGTHTLAFVKDGVLYKVMYNLRNDLKPEMLVGKSGQIDIDPSKDFDESNRIAYKITKFLGQREFHSSHIRVDELGVSSGCKFRITIAAYEVQKVAKDSSFPLLSVYFDSFSDTKTVKAKDQKATAGLCYEQKDLNSLRNEIILDKKVATEFDKIQEKFNAKSELAPLKLKQLLKLA